jgi:hypothetical protein
MSTINNTTNNTIPAIASSEHFNSLLQQARSAITCDSDCQYRKTSQELKDKYLAAQNNLSSGEENVETAKKKYLMFTEGESGYNDYLDTSLNDNADKISELFTNTFQVEISNTNSNIDTYSSLLTNYQNVFDLYAKYKEENMVLEKGLKDNSSDIFTNERKTYYENEGILSLNKYYNILIIIYVITMIIFAISIFTFDSSFSLKIKICILIGLIILPFVSSPILALIVNLIYKIYKLLPKNVLRNL